MGLGTALADVASTSGGRSRAGKVSAVPVTVCNKCLLEHLLLLVVATADFVPRVILRGRSTVLTGSTLLTL